MLKIVLYIALILFISSDVSAEKAGNLPDFGAIVELYGQTSDADHVEAEEQHRVILNSVELTVSGNVHPKIKGDVIFAMHNHEDSLEWELEEAKFTAAKLIGGLGTRGGRALVDIGKLNKVHRHHWPYFTRPAVLQNFIGDHGITADGIQFDYILPLPFHLKVSAGTWEIPHVSTDTDGGHTHGHSESFSLTSHIAAERLSAALVLSDYSKIDIGLSYLEGSGSHHDEHKDRVILYGADLDLRLWTAGYKEISVQGEFFSIKREVPVKEIERNGYYIYLGYDPDWRWTGGIRYDNSDNVMIDNDISESASFIMTYNLKAGSYIRGEYKYDALPETINSFYLQFIFDIGSKIHHTCSH